MNNTLEADAWEIRVTAERRVGELIAAQRESVGLACGMKGKAGPGRGNAGSLATHVSDKPTLADAGIDKDLADRARKLVNMPLPKFEAKVAR
jgi:hypothetical protein